MVFVSKPSARANGFCSKKNICNLTLSSLLILPKFYDLFAEATSVRTFRASLRDFSHFCGTYKKIHDLIGILQKNYTFLPISLINESFLNFFSYLCTVLRTAIYNTTVSFHNNRQVFVFVRGKSTIIPGCANTVFKNNKIPLTRIPTDKKIRG